MDHSQNLADVLVFLAAAVVIVPVFRKFRSSPILGYLVAGIIIGPHGLAIIGDTEAARTLAEFGVVFLLFMVGLELSIGRLRALGSKVFGLGSLQVVVTGTLIGAIAWSLGMGLDAAVIIGGGLALSSTAFVLQLLAERGERATPFGLTAFSILLLQDLAVVPLLILVTLLGTAGSSFVDVIGQATLNGAAALVIVAGFGRYLLRPLYRVIAGVRSAELFVSTTLLVVLGMGWIMSIAGLSMALGALLAGLLLAETEYRHQIEADIRPFRGILLGLFFMTIGMGIDIALIMTHLGLIGVLVIALLAGKSLVTAALCRAVGLPAGVSFRTGLALSQGGEFGFVLFGAAMTLGLIAVDVAQILLAVITISMVATPAMFYAGKTLAGRLDARTGKSQDPIEAEIEGLNNHVLIAGFGRVGQTVAKVLSDAGLAYVALDLDQARVARCRARGMPVYYGDADQINVLRAAGAARADAVVVTIDQAKTASEVVTALRGNYPEVPIYVRARDRRHMHRLEQAGATAVVSEAAESSLQLGSIVLTSLDVSTDDIASVIQSYREDDYAQLEEIV
ncbi:Inner membrane protein, KefB/KefC family [hydrothermal vent metagenome]|uniref:Inner membrane protein, KefB/KefC family n=1 Tax=hydrothermal vent metagenome TaxID=652676 RepID=A0A3B0TD59_9ZZZZ